MSQKLYHDHGHETKDIVKKIPNDKIASNASYVFSLLADKTRLRILWLLCHSEECVTNIALAVDMSSPAVSHHLRFLKQANLIHSRKEGKETYYTLAENEQAILVHRMIDDIFNMDCFK